MQESRRFNFEIFFRLTAAFCFSLTLAVPVIGWLGYRAPGFLILLIAAALFILLYTITAMCPLIVLVVPASLAALATIYYRNPEMVIEWIVPHFTFPQPANAPLWPLINLAFICLYFYLLLSRQKLPVLPLILTGLFVLIPLWYLHIDPAYPAAVFYSLTWLLVLAYRRGSFSWNAPGRGASGEKSRSQVEGENAISAIRDSWLSFTFSVLVLALLVTLVLPKNIEPLPLRPLQNWVRANIPFAGELRSMEEDGVRGDGSEFEFYSFGFQDSRSLGGPLRLDDTVLLEVRGAGDIYLKGTVFEIYTGSRWEKSTLLAEVDDLPLPEDNLYPLLEEIEVNIKHTNLRTKTLFGLLYTAEIASLPGSLAIEGNSSLVVDQEVPLGYKYTVRGYVPAYRFDFSAREAVEVDRWFPGKGFYLSLPAELPQAVVDLAHEIAGGEESYYGRIAALESFLRGSYGYNTEVGSAPDDRDFVEYFLFKRQEGYCTYFATALAVMGRAVGVPTRYVTGFVVPPEADGEGVYQVAGTSAHAWVEAYIPGFGWLPFEATPGFPGGTALPLYRGELVRERPEYDRELLDSWRTALEDQPFAEQYSDLPGETGPVEGEDGVPGYTSLVARAFAVVLILLASGLTGMVLWRLLKLKKYFSELEQKSAREQAVSYYGMTLFLLDKMGLSRYPGETPRQYSQRIIRHVHSWSHNFRDLSEGINLALYSREAVHPKLAADAERFYLFAFNRYQASKGIIKAYTEIIFSTSFLTGNRDGSNFR